MEIETQRRQTEVRELSMRALRELGDATSGIAAMHSAISERTFRALRLGLRDHIGPVKYSHDVIAGGVYSLTAAAFDTAADVAERCANGWGHAPSQTSAGAAVIGALNGLVGDALVAEGSPLATSMAVRVDGVPVSPLRKTIGAAFPHATGHLVIFLHGLMETEFAWGDNSSQSYGSRLRDELAMTPVWVRYNTGRHISQNGRELDRLLSDLVAHWPVPVTDIDIVGHSMGGLVARSACHQALRGASEWAYLVRRMISIGTPHLGAPLARVVHYAALGLGVTRETRPIARLLQRRSAGVRDLFHGSLVDDDWSSTSPSQVRVAVSQDIPLPDHITHCFVSATVTRDARHPLGRLIGDGLVLPASARGDNRKRRLGFRAEDGLSVGRAHHFAILNDDRVYQWIRDRLVDSTSDDSELDKRGGIGDPVRARSMSLGRC